MATESVSPPKQPSISATQTLTYSTLTSENSCLTSDNIASGTKSGSDVERLSRNSSSGDEESMDEPGQLVIDLGNDNDAEKTKRDSISPGTPQNSSSGSEATIKNDNNNNSAVTNSPCYHKRANSSEKNGKTKKGVSSDSLSPYSQNSALINPSKNGKSKSKKSVKSSKCHSSLTSTNSSSLADFGVASLSVACNAGVGNLSSNLSSNKHLQSVDSNPASAQMSGILDEDTRKKSKSSKSKSHHKKHNKHGEKKNSSNVGLKSDSLGEKSKLKSKHGSNLQTNATVSNTFSSSSGSHILPALIPASSSSVAIASKPSFSCSRSDSPNSGNLRNTHSSYPQKTSQVTAQGRNQARAVLSQESTVSGAKIIHAYKNDGDDHGSNSHVQLGKKKLRKSHPLTSSSSISSEMTMTTRESALCSQPESHLIQQSDPTKRDRSNITADVLASDDSATGPKKPRLDADGKCGSISVNSSSDDIRAEPQFQTTSAGESKRATTPLRQTNSPNILRADIGETGRANAGNKLSDYGMPSIAPPVFAPSSLFAHAMPRLSVSKTGEYTSESSPLLDTSSAWSNSNCISDMSRASTDATPSNSHRSVGTVTSTADVGVLTEPDALGPCEPGTSVHLDGIVWHETDTGVLVVNVTWRNKTYVGTLLDATKHDWAPPRFSDNDMDMELRGKNVRPKRARGAVADATRKGRSRGGASYTPDDIKGSPSAAAKRRNKQNSESEAAADSDWSVISTSRSSKRARLTGSRNKETSQQLQQPQSERSTSGLNGGSGSSTCSSPVLVECPHPKCSKRYNVAQISGLHYHQAHAHGDESDETKESGDLNEDDGMCTDQTCSPPEEDAETPDSERSLFAEKGEEARKEDDLSKSSPAPIPSKSSLGDKEDAEENGATLSTEASLAKQKTISIPTGIGQGQNDSYTCIPMQEVPKLSPFSSVGKSSDLTATGATSAPDQTIQASSHPLQTLQSTVSSVIHAELSTGAGKNVKQKSSTEHLASSEASVADESAQAVKTLLQLQDPNDQFLPGLSTPYSQDSPHPTLSLVPRARQAPMQENPQIAQCHSTSSTLGESVLLTSQSVSESMATARPISQLTSVYTTQSLRASAVEARTTLEHSVDSSMSTHAPHTARGIDSEASVSSSHDKSLAHATSLPNRDNIHDIEHRYFPAERTLKESHGTSVSSAIAHPQGVKMAKGKTVPIPVEPNQNLPSSYAGRASPGGLSAVKKAKRKKKMDEKSSSNLPEGDFRNSEGNFPAHRPQPRMSATPGACAASPVSLVTAAATTTNMTTAALQSPQKAQNIAYKPNESAMVLTSHADAAVHIKAEPSLRLPPQHFAGKKLPGVVLHASPNQNQFSNNITVTGTFHPYPDPHKPQTAVSAQAQDRFRSRPLTPNDVNSSSIKSNSHKPTGQHGTSAVGRQQLTESQNTKSKPPSVQVTSPPPEQASQNDQEGNPAPRARYSDPKPRVMSQELALTKMKSRFDSTITNAYRDLTPRNKFSSPIPSEPQKHHDPPSSRPRPPSSEHRAVIIADDSPSQPRERSLTNNPPPRLDPPIEIRDTSPSSQAKLSPSGLSATSTPQAPYPPHVQQLYADGPHSVFPLGGIGYFPSMELAYHQAAAAARTQFLADPRLRQQYEQHMQDLQRHYYLQHQQLLSQQQHDQTEKTAEKIGASGKSTPKSDRPLKQITQPAQDQDKVSIWAHQRPKRVSTGSLSPFQPQTRKEKTQNGNLLHSLPPHLESQQRSYKSPQPGPLTSAPARCHSVVVNSTAPLASSSHSRSESLDRGRVLAIEDRPTVRKSSISPIRKQKSPEKPQDSDEARLEVYRSLPEGHISYYPYPIYDPSRPPTFRGVQHFSVPALPAGYVFPPTGATPMFHGPPGWVPGATVPSGKQSPSLKVPKEHSPVRQRSPSREELSRSRISGKVRDHGGVHYGMKDRRLSEVPNLAVQKLSTSPDPKALVPVQLARNSVGGPPHSVTHRPPSPPTQLHHHTHHHIHEAIPSQYAYRGPTVIAGSDAVAGYSVPYQKRHDVE